MAVQDDDFLTSVRRNNEGHEHFPNSNSANVRKSFIVRHTPGDIEYMAEGFRDKNKDLLREDIVSKLCGSQLKILSTVFKERLEWMKSDQTKKFLGLKIRRQVKELMQEMSTESKLHFIRCIKPNERKEAFLFVERVCYNQIRYLGILDTVQMRKESYHIRTLYSAFYRKYGILEDRLDRLIRLDRGELTDADIKRMVMDMTTQRFAKLSLEYLFGR